MPDNAIYIGRVVHNRFQPRRYRLRHRVFSLLLDLDEIGETECRLRWFSHNRFNVASLHDRDHGPRDGSPLKPWVEDHLRAAGLWKPGMRISLLCFPRLWGYVFNPLSAYYCMDSTGDLVAMLYEVRNTFGEMHGYLLPVQKGSAGETITQTIDKDFFVSPFIPMEARYVFRLNRPGDGLKLVIRDYFDGGLGLSAALSARRRPMTDAMLLRAVATHPLMTFKVMAAIHWHALRLLLLRVPRFKKPPPPDIDVTVGGLQAAPPHARAPLPGHSIPR